MNYFTKEEWLELFLADHKERLVGNIAHETRNMIAIVRGCLELIDIMLKDGMINNKEHVQWALDQSRERVISLENMIKALTEYIRMSAND